ncbi:MAG: response regulator transcription factor [Clostridia bacterium]|nr:response regulator transcription factor [Clostridia bacterium]MDH7573691.1 response regulator transcription factor [Clostridia bacterium]
MAVRVMIVDDHPMVREGLVAMLGPYSDLEVVATCADGEEAVVAAPSVLPDVILMDIRMGGLNGFETTRRILGENPRVKVLFLTIYEDAESIRQALQAGGSGYILKQVTQEKLVEAIRRVYRGEKVIDPELFGRVVNDYARLAQGVGADAAAGAEELTVREQEILRLLARGLTNKEIAAATHLATDTVKTHLRNIYRKLGVRNRSQAVSVALKLFHR